MKEKLINWGIFLSISIIWGSSFILMKEGMKSLSPYQVASIRILSAGFILIPFALQALRKVPKNKLFLVLLSGLLGNFFPAYLFCIAETQIDSSLTGILNALTPLCTVLVGISFFQLKASKINIAGVVIGFIGLSLLMLAGKNVNFTNLGYAALVLLATFFYGINLNMVSRHLQQIGSLNIAALAFVLLIIPSAIILWTTGFLSIHLTSTPVMKAIGASCVLGVFGTALASILFYMLVKRAGTLFASMVSYGIPFVAVFWGILDGEKISLLQVACVGLILYGVYLVNKK